MAINHVFDSTDPKRFSPENLLDYSVEYLKETERFSDIEIGKDYMAVVERLCNSQIWGYDPKAVNPRDFLRDLGTSLEVIASSNSTMDALSSLGLDSAA